MCGTRNIYGKKRSQKAGREIFPILIQVAIDGQDPITDTITYGCLADRIGKPGGALSMHWALGCVLRTLCECREELGIDIPQLTTIVVSKGDGRPTYFSEESGEFRWSDDRIQAEQMAVYDFEQWEHVRETILQKFETSL